MEIENGNAGGNNGMNPDDVLKIVASIIAGFGGFGAVIVLVIKFSANMIANRLAEKYSLKMNKELEKYKGTLESKRHISKALFDREFEIYVLFNKVLADLYNDILLFDGIKNSPNQMITNKELMMHIEHSSLNDNCIEGKFTEQQVDELEEKISNKIFEFRNLLAYSGTFIPHENWILYQELCNACHTYMLTEETSDINGIKMAMGKMQIGIRNYLDQLIIE